MIFNHPSHSLLLYPSVSSFLFIYDEWLKNLEQMQNVKCYAKVVLKLYFEAVGCHAQNLI